LFEVRIICLINLLVKRRTLKPCRCIEFVSFRYELSGKFHAAVVRQTNVLHLTEKIFSNLLL
jgi:hypothetical protein